MTPTSAEIVKAIDRERANVEWINESIASLRKQYGGRYIAVRDRTVIDVDEDFMALLARVKKLPEPEAVTFEYILDAEYEWVL